MNGGFGFFLTLSIRISPVIGMTRKETHILISASLPSALDKLHNLYIGKYDLCDTAKVCVSGRDVLHASNKCFSAAELHKMVHPDFHHS